MNGSRVSERFHWKLSSVNRKALQKGACEIKKRNTISLVAMRGENYGK